LAGFFLGGFGQRLRLALLNQRRQSDALFQSSSVSARSVETKSPWIAASFRTASES